MKIIKYVSLISLILFLSIRVQAETNSSSDINLEAIRLLAQAFSIIKKNIINEVSETELTEHCINGMASGVDPQSSYLNKEQFNDLKIGNRASTAGIGLKLFMKEGYPIVISALEGTPANKAGFKAGDMILQINNKETRGKRLETIVSELRGATGSTIQLRVLLVNKIKARTFKLKRKKIRIKSVKSKLLENKIGYIRISAFLNRTGNKLKNNLALLTKRANGRLNGLILDLRNNPGGLLRAAVEVADTFLDSGLITYAEARYSESEIKYMADSIQLIDGVPIVVLVNESTASASEVVSGALRDHNRATIIGTKTFGSGSIQTVMPLGDGTALKLTTARWITPSGDFIHGKGIKPDLVVKQKTGSVSDYQLKRALSYFKF